MKNKPPKELAKKLLPDINKLAWDELHENGHDPDSIEVGYIAGYAAAELKAQKLVEFIKIVAKEHDCDCGAESDNGSDYSYEDAGCFKHEAMQALAEYKESES